MSNMTPAVYGSFSLTALQHSITLADTKAGFLLAGSIAFLTFLAKEGFQTPDGLPCFAILAALGFIVTAICAAVTVRPRLGAAPSESLAYWRSPIYRQDKNVAVAKAADPDLHAGLDALVGEHLWGLAQVCRSKYRTLNWAFISAVVAVVLFMAWRVDYGSSFHVQQRAAAVQVGAIG